MSPLGGMNAVTLRRNRADLIVVVGAHGGCGASTLARSMVARAEKVLEDGVGHLDVFGGTSVHGDDLLDDLDDLLARHPLVVADAGTVIHAPAAFLRRATAVVIVADPGRNFAAAEAFLDRHVGLTPTARIHPGQVGVLLNRVEPAVDADAARGRFSAHPFLGMVPDVEDPDTAPELEVAAGDGLWTVLGNPAFRPVVLTPRRSFKDRLLRRPPLGIAVTDLEAADEVVADDASDDASDDAVAGTGDGAVTAVEAVEMPALTAAELENLSLDELRALASAQDAE